MNRILNIVFASVLLCSAQGRLFAETIPPNRPNGERPWPAIPEAEVKKIQPAVPEKAQATPQKPRKLLVFYRTDGFPHSSIPRWNKLLELLGEKTGAYQATLSQSYADLQGDRLKEFDAVFFNNTCRMKTPEPVKKALLEYIKSGRGFAGNHGAGDNWHDWAEGTDLIGAEFVCHPYGRIQIKIDDPQSPLTAVFGGKAFPFQDEVYAFKAPYSREKLRVLLSIDYAKSPDVPKAEARLHERAAAKDAKPSDKQFEAAARADHDYAISWVRPWGQGRVFYCSLGHVHEATWNPTIVRFYLAGIQYALGDLTADDAPIAASK